MEKTLPLRIFHPLPELETLWGVTPTDLHQWLQQGYLKAHLWMPLSSLYEVEVEVNGNRIVQTKKLCHREGYLNVLPHDCRRLSHETKTLLREFGGDSSDRRYCLPEGAPGFPVHLDHLVVLTEERLRFETSYRLPDQVGTSIPDADKQARSVQPVFRRIAYQGQVHTFGMLQATLIGLLYQAAKEGAPWMNGKQLLAEAGSLSFSISNLFKRKPSWRSLITSDRLGNYRLDERFLKFLDESGFPDHAPPSSL